MRGRLSPNVFTSLLTAQVWPISPHAFPFLCASLADCPPMSYFPSWLCRFGHYLWADAVIAMIKRTARRVMADLMLGAVLPSLHLGSLSHHGGTTGTVAKAPVARG